MQSTAVDSKRGVQLKGRPISNKIPSPKELVYPDELFYYPLFYAGSRDFQKNSQTSKKERNSVLVPNLVPNDVKKRVRY